MADTFEALLMALTAQLAVPVTAAPITSSAAGTATSGTTETFDAVLGYYQCSLISGRRYMAVLNGLNGNCGVASDIYTIQIRDSGSSSNPTSASTMVAQAQWTSTTTGSLSRVPIPLAGSFIASSSGTHTFGVSATRISGSGAFTPEPPGANAATPFTRELFVMYLGAV
jgi:hypothetical protein